jgi:hypothetical protein
MKDISAAAYQAYRKEYRPWDERWRAFLERLDGREITAGHEPLQTQTL